MSSWEYVFLFPQLPNQLRPAKAVPRLAEFGAEFDGSIRMCIPIDDKGHLLDVGNKIDLNIPFDKDIVRFLEDGKSFSVQLRSEYQFFSVGFIMETQNPHISIGWPSRLFEEAPTTAKTEFWNAIRLFAKDCGADYVLIIDDAPDQFEDRFVDINGKRIIDLQVNHRFGLALKEIWLQSKGFSTLPEGALYGEPEYIGDGFNRYIVFSN